MIDLAARYAKAQSLLPQHLQKLVRSPRVDPNWIGQTETFWYRRATGDGHEFVLVDAAAGTKRPAFDHTRLADALNAVVDTTVDAKALPLSAIEFADGAVRVAVGGKHAEVPLDSYVATEVGPTAHVGETPSPDGRWSVGLRDHNLHIRDTVTDEVRQLTSDGAEDYAYGGVTDPIAIMLDRLTMGFTPPILVWSADSTRFITHRLDQRDVELMHLVQSAPPDGGRPKLLSYHYALPGDKIQATADFFVFDAATGAGTQAKVGPVHTNFVPALLKGWVWWSKDDSKIYWLSNDAGDHNVALHQLDPDTGDDTVLVAESSPSHINYGPGQGDNNTRTLSTGEVLWWSERSGWGHLYLYGTDGAVTALTSGDWMVRHVWSIDEEAGRVVFTAGGRDPDGDPHLQELCSVSLDGGDVTPLTSDGLDHQIHPSPSGTYFVDVASRWDVPAVSVVRDRTGAVVLELEQADASDLYAAGWSAPERAVVKAADGVTDIYCAIYKPFDFDPAASYPVLDDIYPGPQMSSAPLRFPLSGGILTGADNGAGGYPWTFAALGFAVVVVDGRGGPLRSKAFQDAARLPGAVFVDDHVAAITQLAQTRPWMDLERVGIYGLSAGGFASARAILQAPDFYKVAVSSAGNHDNRLNHAWWGEKYFGLPDEFNFAEQANVSLAENLKGKLLLIHGDMDDNAVPHGTMRLVDALIKANKDFDLLIIPNANHGLLSPYFFRRRWDYFVQHLMGEAPPE